MQIQLHTDSNIRGTTQLMENIEADLTQTLARFGDQITRVEVHLSDANGPKRGGDAKTCLLETRLAGRPPVVVSHDSATLRQAIDGATNKLERALDHLVDKLSDRRGRSSFSGDGSIADN